MRASSQPRARLPPTYWRAVIAEVEAPGSPARRCQRRSGSAPRRSAGRWSRQRRVGARTRPRTGRRSSRALCALPRARALHVGGDDRRRLLLVAHAPRRAAQAPDHVRDLPAVVTLVRRRRIVGGDRLPGEVFDELHRRVDPAGWLKPQRRRVEALKHDVTGGAAESLVRAGRDRVPRVERECDCQPRAQRGRLLTFRRRWQDQLALCVVREREGSARRSAAPTAGASVRSTGRSSRIWAASGCAVTPPASRSRSRRTRAR